MQVPNPQNLKVVGQQGQLAPVQANIPAGGLGANVAQALSHLGTNLQALDERTKLRNDQTEKFGALTAYTDFQQHMEGVLTEAKRQYPADAKGFADTAASLYDQESRKFIAEKIPPQLQDEFTYRVGEMKTGVVSDALSFQYKQGDAYFVQGVNDQYQRALSAVGANPDSADGQVKQLNEIIDATDLAEADKQRIKHDSAIGIYGVLLKDKLKKSAATVGNVPLTGDTETNAIALIHDVEGHVFTTPFMDTNTRGGPGERRIGYSSDTITRIGPDGKETVQHGVGPNDTVTPEEAMLDLKRRLRESGNAWKGVMGEEKWNALGPAAQAAMLSLNYNYGDNNKALANVREAAKTGDAGKIAAAVAALPDNHSRRLKEASIIAGKTVVDTSVLNDPRFADIPYETKVKLQDDAETEATREHAQQMAADKAAHEAALNDLAVKLHDGNAGASDIMKMRQSGQLSNIDEIEKMETILKKKQEEGGDVNTGLMKLATGAVWDKNDKDSQKQLNAIVTQDQGLNRIGQGDAGYIGGQIIPMVSQSGMIPSSVAGVLATMGAGNNNKQFKFAFDSMARLQQASPEAFNAAFNDEQKAQLMRYHAMKDNVPDEELQKWVRGGTSTEERQFTRKLEEDAVKMLAEKDSNDLPTEQSLFDKVIDSFDPGTFVNGPSAPENVLLRGQMMKDFHDTFVTEYPHYGDPAKATEASIAMLKTRWGITNIGNSNTVQKYPLEMMYPEVNKSHDWIENAIRTDAKIPTGQVFSYLSDEKTKNEWDKYKADRMSTVEAIREAATPPSVKIILADPDGSYHFAPGRVWVKPSQADLDKERITTNLQGEHATSQRIIDQYNNRYGHAGALGLGGPIQEPTPKDKAQYDEMVKRRDAAAEQMKILNPKPAFKTPSRMDAFKAQ